MFFIFHRAALSSQRLAGALSLLSLPVPATLISVSSWVGGFHRKPGLLTSAPHSARTQHPLHIHNPFYPHDVPPFIQAGRNCVICKLSQLAKGQSTELNLGLAWALAIAQPGSPGPAQTRLSSGVCVSVSE